MKNELEQAMFIGMYLSKFDTEALDFLGFRNFKEAYNIIGLAIGAKPSSIKNYRDEFDPIFPNKRQGWHKRPMYTSRVAMLEKYKNLNFQEFTNLVKQMIYKNSQTELLLDEIEEDSKQFSKRLLTGLSAEEYFRQSFSQVAIFEEFELEDTTKMGCGFDFRIYRGSEFYAVEVKGLSGIGGNILLTPKEHKVATYLKDRYGLFVVQNFIDKPFHKIFFNPLENENLFFNKQEQIITQINWISKI